jgi:hypothetical protein
MSGMLTSLAAEINSLFSHLLYRRTLQYAHNLFIQ